MNADFPQFKCGMKFPVVSIYMSLDDSVRLSIDQTPKKQSIPRGIPYRLNHKYAFKWNNSKSNNNNNKTANIIKLLGFWYFQKIWTSRGRTCRIDLEMNDTNEKRKRYMIVYYVGVGVNRQPYDYLIITLANIDVDFGWRDKIVCGVISVISASFRLPTALADIRMCMTLLLCICIWLSWRPSTQCTLNWGVGCAGVHDVMSLRYDNIIEIEYNRNENRIWLVFFLSLAFSHSIKGWHL